MRGKLVGQGNTAEIYGYGEGKILKLYRSWMPKELCEREFKASKIVYETVGLSPRVYEQVEVDGRPGIVFERVEGVSMLKRILFSPWKVGTRSRELARCHISIHRPVGAEGETVKDRLKAEIATLSELTGEEKESLIAYTDGLPDGACLCHFDFHPDNLLLCGDRTVVIDWMTTVIGDPLADVARTSVILKYARLPRAPRLVVWAASLLQKRMYKAYIGEYLRLSGETLKKVERWELPIAAARLKEQPSKSEKEMLLAVVGRGLEALVKTI